MQQYKLDYDTIYNGRGREIEEMITNYFGNDSIKLISKKELVPDRPGRDNVVGLKYEFALDNDIVFACGIGMRVNFVLISINGKKKLISEGDYMTWDKLESLAFSLTDKVVIEKLEIFDNVIRQVRKGEEITKIDIENKYHYVEKHKQMK